MPQQPQHGSKAFVRLVNRITDSLVTNDDGALDEVKKVLIQVHQQYDAVHSEAEVKESKLRKLREEIRTADQLHMNKGDTTKRIDDNFVELETQYQDVINRNKEIQTSKKVYEHMLKRIQREQAILKQKMFQMEEFLDRRKRILQQKRLDSERVRCARVQMARTHAACDEESKLEGRSRKIALDTIEGELNKRKEGNRRRADFESWRHEVALDAANEAFSASAGRLRKLYAIEKLSGNSLQKDTFEQVETSQNTEDGFQKIRDVTGLADVMDIVHKFLNRDMEEQQLKVSVKEAELKLESLRQDYEAAKQKAEGITFDDGLNAGDLYKETERAERELNDAMEEHEASGARLQKATLQTEHMKRWAVRIGGMLSQFEEPSKVEEPSDLPVFFKKLEQAVKKFVARVSQQIREGKINRKSLQQMANKEYQEQTRLIMQVAQEAAGKGGGGRPTSRQGGGGAGAEEGNFAEDRELRKQESEELALKAQRTAEQSKKRPTKNN
mmetsp:Transcript_97184/g.173136  ORF Transcript_97184/g.173136 Transcript_97184/m.173136 type:complete len:499 (+) Transcript_97184:96-1592(+)|eukprot:CAMPEP_0197658792 /NCGR_PEP_ID=MMETSP1338-20131121/45443_1 /TAXON_ID=43686 ORGANISM="Pelagodinium beii, Strain RCC1491" /NCGR_SAMPLE_ID=MMETSP1338 /ASSEMBLY_ACC=CAM_ASM_000754 /LENGTH=498 /DNA_ID=CAMNT_0043235441 /DNA_START=86 /DNA_END=1582 /DNA_ORIENTATION=-